MGIVAAFMVGMMIGAVVTFLSVMLWGAVVHITEE